MSNTVNKLTSVPEPPVEPVRPIVSEAHPAPQLSSAHGDQSRIRLIIEEDQGSGSFVYKTLNRDTGEVINQFPREQVLKLKQEARYQAGAIIRTSV